MPIGYYGPLSASAAMLDASGPSRMPIGFGQVMGAGLAGMLQGLPLDEKSQRQRSTQSALGRIGQTLGAPSVKNAWTATAAPLARSAGVPMTYLASLAQSESGNRNIGQQINDTGTAFGPFQFTEGTWADQIQRHPELGLTPADRFSPEAQGKVAVQFTKDNAATLQAALGRTPGKAELGLAHRFGSSGAMALLRAKRNQSVATVMPDAVKANPQLAEMTVGDVIDNTSKAVGAQTPAVRQSASLLEDGSTSVTTGGGLAELLGGGQIAPQPFGAGLQNMTPQFREILQIALSDPTLGPAALQTLLQVGASDGRSRHGGGTDLPSRIQELILAGVPQSEWPKYITNAPNAASTATSAQKDAQALGLKPGTPEYDAYIRQRTLPQAAAAPSVTVNVPGQPRPETEKAADKAFGEALGKMAGNLVDTAPQRRQDLAAVDASERLLSRLETAGREPGKWADVKNELARGYYTVTGQKVPEDVQDFRTFQAQLNKDVLGMIGKGGIPANNFSDADRAFIQQIATSAQDDPDTLRAKFAIRRGTIKAEDFLMKEIMTMRKQGMPTEEAVNVAMDKLQSRDFIANEPAIKKWSQVQQPGAAPAKAAPTPGTIESGYRFKGGNPADPNSWEKVR